MFWFFRKQRKKQRQNKETKIKTSTIIQTDHTSEVHEYFTSKTLLELHDIIIAFKIKQYQVGLSFEEREQLLQAKQVCELMRRI